MFNKFTEGLAFGGGFGVSFLIVWYLAAYFISPMLIESQVYETTPQTSTQKDNKKPKVPFHELSNDNLIKQSSVIALAEFEPSADGRMKAIIKEFLKMEPGTKTYFKVGDEHPSSSYYPKEGLSHGDGVIIFYKGSPAKYKRTSSFYDGRIPSFGDIPLELFKKKCRGENA